MKPAIKWKYNQGLHVEYTTDGLADLKILFLLSKFNQDPENENIR